MNELRIIVGDPNNYICMGKQDAKRLFKNVPKGVCNIIFDFNYIFHVGFLFVKEYLLLKKSLDINVVEINLNDEVQDTFDIVNRLGVDCYDEEFIQKFIDYDLNSL